MKLDHSMSGACAAATLAVALACFACGCSSSAACVASSPAQQQAALDGRTATTQLMSAQLAGPAPRVGRAHLAVEQGETGDTATDLADELNAPKEARRSDGSRRSGGFGTSK